MGEMLARLEEAGFVKRTKSTSDRRAFTLALTRRGESALVEVGRAAEEQLEMLTRKMGAKEIKELTRLLNLANDAMGGPIAEEVE